MKWKGKRYVLFTVIAEKFLNSLHPNVIVTANIVLDSTYSVFVPVINPHDTLVNPTDFPDTSYISFEDSNTIETSITAGTIPAGGLWAYKLHFTNDTSASYQGDTMRSVRLATDPISFSSPSPGMMRI